MNDHHWELLRAVASKQGGLITRKQAMRTGMPASQWDWLGESRCVKPIFRGLYQVDGPCTDDRRDLRAALLLAGDSSVVSHRSAARLHRFWGVDGCPVEVTVPRRLSLEAATVTVHRGEVPPEDTCRVADMTVTTPERTLIDLAPLVDRVNLACMLESARRQDRNLVDALAARIETAGFTAALERSLDVLLADCDARTRPMDSPFEVQFWHRWPYTGLPMPSPQHEVRDERGRMYIDFAWPEERVAVETQGYEVRNTKESFDYDSGRTNRLVRLGWLVIPVPYTLFREAFFRDVMTAVGDALKDRRKR